MLRIDIPFFGRTEQVSGLEVRILLDVLTFPVQPRQFKEAEGVVTSGPLDVILNRLFAVNWREVTLQEDHAEVEVSMADSSVGSVLELAQTLLKYLFPLSF